MYIVEVMCVFGIVVMIRFRSRFEDKYFGICFGCGYGCVKSCIFVINYCDIILCYGFIFLMKYGLF